MIHLKIGTVESSRPTSLTLLPRGGSRGSKVRSSVQSLSRLNFIIFRKMGQITDRVDVTTVQPVHQANHEMSKFN